MDIENEVVLLGNWRECEQFYFLFRNHFKIKYLILKEGYDKSLRNRNCLPELIKYGSTRAEEIILKYYIILCTELDEWDRSRWDYILYKKSFYFEDDYMDSLYYRLEYDKKKIDQNRIREKNIWIFGAGQSGSNFYRQYKDTLDIKGFISNWDEEKEFCGLPVVRPDYIMDIEDIFIVICSDAQIEMAEKLVNMGYSSEKDFGFPVEFRNKLFVAMGNCQENIIRSVVSLNRYFWNNYTVLYIEDSVWMKSSYANRRREKIYGKLSDAVLYRMAFVDNGSEIGHERLIEKEYQGAVKLKYPFYFFNGQFMQMDMPTVSDEAYINFEKYYRAIGGGYRDKEIRELLESGYSHDEIYEKISNENYWSYEEIVDNFNKAVKRVKVLDRKSSFNVADYILQNYKTELIFYDTIHINWNLACYLADTVAEKLGINVSYDMKGMEELREKWYTKTNEYVYPCVAKALGMDFAKDLVYESKKDGVYLSDREYVEELINFISIVRDLT